MYNFLDEAQALFEYTRSLRRDFHIHPELGFQEVRTAGIVAKELTALGLEIHSGMAETGVVAVLEGKVPDRLFLSEPTWMPSLSWKKQVPNTLRKTVA